MRIPIISFLGLIFLALSCEIIPLSEHELPEYDGELSWTELTSKADWSDRYDHSALAFDNKLWVFGGYNPGQVKGDTYYEDVWSSSDGINWELINDNAPWNGRRGHASLTFNDGSGEAMYLIGGYSVDEESGYRQYNNDVWKSTDGENWENIKARTYPELSDSSDWMPRMHHACVTANHGGVDYIYLIGGRTQLENHSAVYANVYFNDVWRTTDGISWEKLPNNDYGIRSELAATTDPSTGRIYLQGGAHGVIFEAEDHTTHPLPDWQNLWYSDDGIHWESERNTDIVPNDYLFRGAHDMVFYEDKLWVLPGKTTSNVHYHFVDEKYWANWTYEADSTWAVDSEGTVMDPRHSYATVLFKDKIWILGGFTDRMAQDNDVWTAEY